MYKALKSFFEKTLSRIIYAGDIIELPKNRAEELKGFVEPVELEDDDVFDPLTGNMKTVKKLAKDMEIDVEGKSNEEIRKIVAEEMAKSYEAENPDTNPEDGEGTNPDTNPEEV